MDPILPAPHANSAPERPSSPLPTHERMQGIVSHVLGSDKIVIPENSLLLPSDTSLNEILQQQYIQLERGVQAALDTRRPHTEHAYQSYPSVQAARSRLETLQMIYRSCHQMSVLTQQLGSQEPLAVNLVEENRRGYKVRIRLNNVGYPVDVISHTELAPNHNDARVRTLVTESTFIPQEN